MKAYWQNSEFMNNKLRQKTNEIRIELQNYFTHLQNTRTKNFAHFLSFWVVNNMIPLKFMLIEITIEFRFNHQTFKECQNVFC